MMMATCRLRTLLTDKEYKDAFLEQKGENIVYTKLLSIAKRFIYNYIVVQNATEMYTGISSFTKI